MDQKENSVQGRDFQCDVIQEEENALKHASHWYPSTQLPPIETDIVVWCILDDKQIHVGLCSLSENKWPAALEKYVKYWCYTPKN